MKKTSLILASATYLILAIVLQSCKDPIPTVVVTTNRVTGITTNSAQISGCLTSAENTVITELGLCWNTTPNPEVGDSHVSSSNIGETLCHTLTELQLETVYHVRAYAFDGLEYYYGEDVEFTTLPKGLFTVAHYDEYHKIRIAKGNLQYQASTNTWRFAEHQWDYIGYSEPDQYGFTYGTVEGSSNHLISPDYDGWIDLFGWGTSGQDHGAICYQPWSTSTNDADYYAYGQYYNDLGRQADWGINPIINGGNQPDLWRTLSIKEWRYLLKERNTLSGIRYAAAYLNDILGIVIVPDDWDNTIYPLNATPLETNNISLETWELLEENGVVFLPTTGFREGTYASGGYNYGGYWTSSKITQYGSSEPWAAWNFRTSDALIYFEDSGRHTGLSVRLVQDYPTSTP